MATFTTEQILNDLSRVSVVDDTAFLAGPAVTAVIAAGGTLANAAYFYKVTSVNVYGESTPGAEGTATSASTNQTANLTWTVVPGAVSYNIYRGTVTNTENKLIGTSLVGSFSDTGITGTTATPPTTNTAAVVTDPGVPSGQKALVIQRLNKFLSGSTTAVYKRAGTNPAFEVATIVLPNQSYAAGVYRLSLDVLSLGSYPADYNRWAINKGKPFYIEVNLATTAANGNAFAVAIFPQLKTGLVKSNGSVIQDVAITDTASGTTGSIILTAASEYLRFKSAVIEQYLVDPIVAGEYYFQTLLTGTVTTPGVEGFGTSWYLTKNFRIPTDEAIRFMGLDQDERPINGVLYNQYTIAYDAKRNIGSQDIVGSLLSSHTDHVLYIPATLATTFESNLTSAFGAGFLTTIV
jgi:hypothetical protein